MFSHEPFAKGLVVMDRAFFLRDAGVFVIGRFYFNTDESGSVGERRFIDESLVVAGTESAF